MNSIRFGRVSSVNYQKGMISVTYADQEDGASVELPYFSFNGEYKMPKKEQMVLVLHLTNGSAAGIVLGTFWNANNVPKESGENAFWKELCDGVVLKARNGRIETTGKEFVINGISVLQKLSELEQRVSALGG